MLKKQTTGPQGELRGWSGHTAAWVLKIEVPPAGSHWHDPCATLAHQRWLRLSLTLLLFQHPHLAVVCCSLLQHCHDIPHLTLRERIRADWHLNLNDLKAEKTIAK